MKKILSAVVVSAIALLSVPTSAQANTAPNPYTSVGEAWVDVPDADRVYAENFGETSGRDDKTFRYVAAGITCTDNSVSATGPFWTTEDLGDGDCVDGSTNPVDPFDDGTGLGSYPLGFDVNFFGDTKDSAWPNTNGGVFFDQPNSRYDRSVASLTAAAESSAIFPLAGDLYWDHTESNFWTGEKTINGHDAVVFSWEKFHNCCNSDDGGENISFQLVLIDLGSGDFDAWFNYDAFDQFTEGYHAPEFTVDMNAGVTVDSNVVKGFPDIYNVPNECSGVEMTRDYGDFTDVAFYDEWNDDDFYAKAESLAKKTVSLWSDDTCTTPINFNLKQDIAADKNAYMVIYVNEIVGNSDWNNYDSIGMGWGTYNQTDGKVSSTELLHNIDWEPLLDNGDDPLINRSWNTTVHGRMVLGQRDGGTIGDPVSSGGSGGGGGKTIDALAFTGVDTTSALALAFAMLALGGGAVAVRRLRRQR